MKRISYFFFLALFLFAACDPVMEDGVDLGPLPPAPEISVAMVPGDSNRMVVKDLSVGNFNRLWDFPGGEPRTSQQVEDTVFYAKAGTFTITLNVAAAGGNGTAFSSREVTILRDAPVVCGELESLLTGGCEAAGKCWTFSSSAGAISVGPTYGSTEWFTSTANGLDPSQYDDRYCFFFEDRVFEYRNNGTTVNPWQGYVPVPFNPPPANWSLRPGAGRDGADQIVLPDGYFMGVWDSGPVLDIVTLTETELVVRAYIVDETGSQAAEGWFQLHFVAE